MTDDEERTGDRPIPPCPECGARTEPLDVENAVEDDGIWRCTREDCRRRTYGLPDGEDDENLPAWEENGVAYHGTGEVDCEATDFLRQIREEEQEDPDLD
jgi:hypothetical protein